MSPWTIPEICVNLDLFNQTDKNHFFSYKPS